MSSSAARRLRRATRQESPPGIPLLVRAHSLLCRAPLFACSCTPRLTLVPSASKAIVETGLRMADARAARIRNALD
jgi:hypothetical protein